MNSVRILDVDRDLMDVEVRAESVFVWACDDEHAVGLELDTYAVKQLAKQLNTFLARAREAECAY